MLDAVQRQVVFVGKFLRSPRRIGAILPSSSALAEEIVKQARVQKADAVLELGPGTGAFTRQIITAMPPNARLLSIEADASLALLVRKKFQHITVAAGYAQNARRIMKAYKFPRPDSIVSGLPWALFDSTTQQDILTEAHAVLKPGGTFATFAYVHALSFPEAKAFRSLIEKSFSCIRTSRIIWNNLPPAIVYTCRKEN